MSDPYYLTDGGHVLISGATGAKAEYGGKTTTANWWFEQSVEKGWHDQGVFINPKGHSNVRGQSVSTLKGLAESYRAGHRLFSWEGAADADAVDHVVGFFRHLSGETIVVFDEAQSYRDSDGLNWVLSQGGNLDSGSFTALVLTQRPWNLSEELRGNLPVKIWVGPITSEGRKFFEVEHMKRVASQLAGEMEPYSWAVTDGGDFQHVNPPVPEAYA
jgi:hypothetical protein